MDANELFRGWKDNPPVSILVKALLEGLGGKSEPDNRAAVSKLENDARLTNILPVLHRPDPGLQGRENVVDITELRRRNEEVAKRLRIVDKRR